MVDQYVDENGPAVETRRCAWIDPETGKRIEADLDEIAVFAATGNVVEFPTGKRIDPAPSAELVPSKSLASLRKAACSPRKFAWRQIARPQSIPVSAACPAARWNEYSFLTGASSPRALAISLPTPPSP